MSTRTHLTLPTLIDELADEFGPNVALLDAEERLSYRALAERANRYARWALAQHLGVGDVVCLLMPNCPDYVAAWLGITRVGAIAALLNTNLTGGSLAHAIRTVAPAQVIVGAEYAQAITALVGLSASIRWWRHGETGDERDGLPRIDRAVRSYSGERLAKGEHAALSGGDVALHIYTSGTTGMPKAANVSHFRLLQWSYWFAGLMDTQAGDRMYNCLPMYHSIGGVVAIGSLLVSGGSVLIRPRFSATRFWDDVVEGECTLFQYIGELCRYLLNAPAHPREAEHRLRLCCGNGLRKDVWSGFQDRFRIPHILEFYAATEGNVSLFNCEEMPGAIGRFPPFLAHRFPVSLVKCDPDTAEPIRDANGRCTRCAPNEIGEAIGRIGGPRDRLSQFEGYTDSSASERKVLRDVFAEGDAWFRTGDLMRKDEAGYFYFVDRLGDTFRWKAENVSTVEVAETICSCPGVLEAAVYGVAVPGAEGRAGMAAIAVGEAFSMTALWHHLVEHLPEYARPLFVRVCDVLEATGTFKLTKARLVRDGYDPGASTDAVWLGDRSSQAFIKLSAALHARIRQGEHRL